MLLIDAPPFRFNISPLKKGKVVSERAKLLAQVEALRNEKFDATKVLWFIQFLIIFHCLNIDFNPGLPAEEVEQKAPSCSFGAVLSLRGRGGAEPSQD